MRIGVFLILIFCLLPLCAKAIEHVYTFRVIEAAEDDAPTLPDISGYTSGKIEEKIPSKTAATIALNSFSSIRGMWKFTQPEYLSLYQGMQNQKSPEAIVISEGVADLQDVLAALNTKSVINQTDGIYNIKRPIYVGKNATLIIKGISADEKLKVALSLQDGTFIMNAGNLFVQDADIYAWDNIQKIYAPFVDHTSFRPFMVSAGGSETYLSDSIFRNLGYKATKSYGVSFSTDGKLSEPGVPWPKGWIINSRFEGIYYGFYSFEAEDVAIIGNKYAGNIYYAIDPHDRSRRLIIANNDTSGTRNRHGIIISRGVDDSYIFNNRSYKNVGAGIMIDRSSRNNVVYGNYSYDNESYGIAIFESPDNYIGQNVVSNNEKDGLRIRNSWNIKSINNHIDNNNSWGVNITAVSLKEESERDFVRDPYTIRADLIIRGGSILNNTKGNMRFENLDSMEVSNTILKGTTHKQIVGEIALSDLNTLLEKNNEKKGVQITWPPKEKTQ